MTESTVYLYTNSYARTALNSVIHVSTVSKPYLETSTYQV